ncbi:hypothetical protein [Krasilnikovia sp. MM14-A1259]|uniref:hypothetical protein n=1 Tax=Krasilnikovia sp. MM14-A1259 TaxID=3373539 RepID=UPI0037F525A6
MVSQGRALAVAAAWIVVPLTAAGGALCVAFPARDGWNGLIPWIALAGVLFMTPIALLAAAVWVARQSGSARSASGLGAQAGLIGLVVAVVFAAGYVAVHTG